jgi:hypothetical protein
MAWAPFLVMRWLSKRFVATLCEKTIVKEVVSIEKLLEVDDNQGRMHAKNEISKYTHELMVSQTNL